MCEESCLPVHWCVMCSFETTDEVEAYEHDCMAEQSTEVCTDSFVKPEDIL